MFSPDQAKYLLHGNCVVGDEGMEITLHLSKARSHAIELTRSTFLAATAYAGLQAEPSQPMGICESLGNMRMKLGKMHAANGDNPRNDLKSSVMTAIASSPR